MQWFGCDAKRITCSVCIWRVCVWHQGQPWTDSLPTWTSIVSEYIIASSIDSINGCTHWWACKVDPGLCVCNVIQLTGWSPPQLITPYLLQSTSETLLANWVSVKTLEVHEPSICCLPYSGNFSQEKIFMIFTDCDLWKYSLQTFSFLIYPYAYILRVRLLTNFFA